MGGAQGRSRCGEQFASTRRKASGRNMSTASRAPKRCRKAGNKKVRSGRCFAAHLLSVHCVGFGWMVRKKRLFLQLFRLFSIIGEIADDRLH